MPGSKGGGSGGGAYERDGGRGSYLRLVEQHEVQVELGLNEAQRQHIAQIRERVKTVEDYYFSDSLDAIRVYDEALSDQAV